MHSDAKVCSPQAQSSSLETATGRGGCIVHMHAKNRRADTHTGGQHVHNRRRKAALGLAGV